MLTDVGKRGEKRRYKVASLKCILSIRWQERVFFSVQKETRDLLHTPREKRERSERTSKIGGEIPRRENY